MYGYSTLETFRKNESQIADATINDTFGSTNLMALLVPTGDYAKEKSLRADLTRMEHVDSALGLSNIEAMDG